MSFDPLCLNFRVKLLHWWCSGGLRRPALDVQCKRRAMCSGCIIRSDSGSNCCPRCPRWCEVTLAEENANSTLKGAEHYLPLVWLGETKWQGLGKKLLCSWIATRMQIIVWVEDKWFIELKPEEMLQQLSSWRFIHIPKCAGTSFKADAALVVAPAPFQENDAPCQSLVHFEMDRMMRSSITFLLPKQDNLAASRRSRGKATWLSSFDGSKMGFQVVQQLLSNFLFLQSTRDPKTVLHSEALHIQMVK